MKTADDVAFEVYVAFTAGDSQRGIDIIAAAMAAVRAEALEEAEDLVVECECGKHGGLMNAARAIRALAKAGGRP